MTVTDPSGQVGQHVLRRGPLPAEPVPLTTGPDAVSVAVGPPDTTDTGGVQAQVAVVAPFDLVFTFSGGMTASPEIYSHYALGDPQVTIDTTTYEPVAGQLIQNSGQSGDQVISLIATRRWPGPPQGHHRRLGSPAASRRDRSRRLVRPGGAG